MTEYGSLPFEEAEQFFRDKLRIPTRRWDDLQRGMHARGFMIAGAMRDDMLCDFQTALLKGIAQGTTLEEFREGFDAIVSRYGWSYNGSRGWRTRVIYDTNLRTAYMAGRYKQMTDPDVLAARPYWRYRHGDSLHPRLIHLSWDGLVLRYDHPWWSTHYTPNGWGCTCWIETLSLRGLHRLGKTGPDEAPPIEIDAKTGAPVGIDQGWDYNVGEAAWGKRLSDEAMDEWRKMMGKAWERMSPGDWMTFGRPERIPVDEPLAQLGPVIIDREEAIAALQQILGGEEAIYTAPAGAHVLVHAESLIDHIAGDLAARTPYLPLIRETIEHPYEIWISFERHKGTGRVELRQRFLKVIRTNKDRAVIIVTQVRGGTLEAWTMFASPNRKYQNNQRVGRMLWGRELTEE
ncbi:PBECR2 nuclease fold domain-containing protein [Desulfobulbus elongatus]|uniref:PBECR2 nuclease fold domain-containing protein n=1 Tax=Desulfobulbus elongatus TaxID=53332 RepID=UPI000687FFA2|nr:PBECR2 nuclease fold domain-containing protein [Desulfobulbus elongatus]